MLCRRGRRPGDAAAEDLPNAYSAVRPRKRERPKRRSSGLKMSLKPVGPDILRYGHKKLSCAGDRHGEGPRPEHRELP